MVGISFLVKLLNIICKLPRLFVICKDQSCLRLTDMGWFLGRGGFYSLDNNCRRRRRVEFTHRGCGMISLLLTVKLCCGFVCVICVWGLYPLSSPTPTFDHILLWILSLIFFFFFYSPFRSCIMWSGWTCIVIRPYGGGGGVSESAWRWLNNSKQSFLSMETPLGQTRLMCSSVLVSLPDRRLTSNPDVTHGFWSTVDSFQNTF